LRSNTKKKRGHYEIKKSQTSYEYKVGDQVISETPGTIRKLSAPRAGTYPVTKVYNIGISRIQKGKKELYQKE
jgi:hypothetical protein